MGGLRAAMGIQKNIKAPLTLAKHVGQYGWVLKNQRADFIKSFVQGKHRIGGPGFAAAPPDQQTRALEDLLKGSAAANRGLAAIDKASDIASLKNLNKYIGPLIKVRGRCLEEKPWLGAGTKLEWLGKSGLARGLGWAGVGFSAVDSVQSFADGDIKGGAGQRGQGTSRRRLLPAAARPEPSARSPASGLPSTRTGTPSAASARISAKESSTRSRIPANSSAMPRIPSKMPAKSVANFFGFGD